jgi:hypothetical protein
MRVIGTGVSGCVLTTDADPTTVTKVFVDAHTAYLEIQANARVRAVDEGRAFTVPVLRTGVLTLANVPALRQWAAAMDVVGPSAHYIVTPHGGTPVTTFGPHLASVVHGVATLARAGLVHRDIKPPNVLVPADGGGGPARLIDFGLCALATDVFSPGVHNRLVGGGDYPVWPPEYKAWRVAGTRVDALTAARKLDVYSLGFLATTLYRANRAHPPPKVRTWIRLTTETNVRHRLSADTAALAFDCLWRDAITPAYFAALFHRVADEYEPRILSGAVAARVARVLLLALQLDNTSFPVALDSVHGVEALQAVAAVVSGAGSGGGVVSAPLCGVILHTT